MRKSVTRLAAAGLTVALLIPAYISSSGEKFEVPPQPPVVEAVAKEEVKPVKSIEIRTLPEVEEIVVEEEITMSTEDIELIALVTMAEAEGEPEEGQRLVIDTILNRVDGEYWPDNVYDVIYQPNQFSSMWCERVKRCYVKEELCELVREELRSRTNSEVVFFRTTHYSKYGVPMFQVGNHYFSSYD